MYLQAFTNKLRSKLYSSLLYRFGFGNRISRSIWEDQFSGKHWDYLFSKPESQHYQAIVSLYEQFGKKGKILDVGCGQGVLYQYLNEKFGQDLNYLGIDISEAAIKKATALFPTGNFKQLDFDKQALFEKFDIIIFNETLYYFTKPLDTVESCTANNLNANGSIIISMCDLPGHKVIWKGLKEKYEFLSFQEVQNEKLQKWYVAFLDVLKVAACWLMAFEPAESLIYL